MAAHSNKSSYYEEMERYVREYERKDGMMVCVNEEVCLVLRNKILEERATRDGEKHLQGSPSGRTTTREPEPLSGISSYEQAHCVE